MNEMKHIGAKYPVHDAILKATGRAEYTTDMEVPGMLYGKILLSDRAHARVISIDTSEAGKLDGVHAVCTWEDAPDVIFNCYHRFEGHDLPKDEMIFNREVRFIGDRIAAVAADTPEIAAAAVKLIKLEYEDLPSVFTIDEAMEKNSPRVHENSPNLINKMEIGFGDTDKGFDEADFIYEGTYRTPAVYHASMETHCAIADFAPDGHLDLWCTTQNIFATRLLICQIFDLPRNRVRVKKPILGGAFGGKVPMSVEPVAVLLSKKAGLPVKIEMSRREDIAASNTRHAARIKLKTGIKKDGTLTAQEIEYVVNTGAYHTGGNSVAGAVCYKVPQLYKLANLRMTAIPVYSNITPAGAMRGYGAPQLFYAQQAHLNRICRELKIDFTDFQLNNLAEPNSINPLTGGSNGNIRGLDCVIRGKELFGWEEKQGIKSTDLLKRGIGMAVSSLWNGVYGVHIDASGMRITMNEDGTCILHTPAHDMGHGTTIVLCQIVAEVLEINPGDIRVVESDTDSCLWDLGAFASRGVYVCGEAARLTAEKMRKEILREAGLLLKVNSETLDIKEKWIVKKGKDERLISYHDLMTRLLLENNKHLEVNYLYGSVADRTSYGAHFAEVEVNMETGKIKVVDYAAVHDVGRVINRLGIEGQLEGGVQMGLGYALSEDMIRDEKGKLKNTTFRNYKMFRALDMPEIKSDYIEEGEMPGPFGAKSIAEIATTVVAPAVVNAIADALNRDFESIPILPEQIISG
jgi:CO/xanthine dehydrogenase Mo-binding subunit